MEKTRVEAPKMFRDSENVTLKNVTFTDAKETFWTCRGVRLTDCVTDGGDTMYMHSADIELINAATAETMRFSGAATWRSEIASSTARTRSGILKTSRSMTPKLTANTSAGTRKI